jgi:hypothetical protein
MNITRTSILILAAGVAAFAQQWELGGSVGGNFIPTKSITNSAGSATTGFQNGFAVGGYLGQTISAHIGGEIRYTFMPANMKLSSGGMSTSFSGQAHAVHYDFLWHTSRKGSKAQLFAAAGGGMKYFRGTGKESAYQPLSQFAYLTHTNKVEPMISFGGGVKMSLSERITMRAEVRDYLTPFPTELITPAPPGKISGWLHDIVPMVSISYGY